MTPKPGNNNERVHKLQDFEFDQLNYVLRPNQEEALLKTQNIITSGKKFTILEMPTGSGKSIFAMYLAKWYKANINSKMKVDIITHGKILQAQYVKDFEYINNLNGKGNYYCEEHHTSCENASIINKAKSCPATCEDCPYAEAKERYMDGRITVTNFHVMGLNRIHNPQFNESRKANLLIIDEAHLIEDVVNGFLSINITQRMFDKYIDFSLHKVDVNDYRAALHNISTIQDAVQWIERTFLPDLESSKKSLSRSKDTAKVIDSANVIKQTEELITRFKEVCKNYHKNPVNYVLDFKIIKNEVALSVQPLWTAELLDKYIYAHYTHVIFMSGTVVSPDTFMKINGIDPTRAAYLSLDSTFPPENRPIYYYPLGKMSYTAKAQTWKEYVPIIKRIIKKYEGKKGIIHAGTYEIMQWLMMAIPNERLIFATPETREASLLLHCNSPNDTILVSPSMAEGIDLIDDASRFQIILKIPYPNLQSVVNKQRLQENPHWFAMKTVQKLLQAYGRSIRSADDFADTFILDSCFGDVLRNNSAMIPRYVHDSIKYLKSKTSY